MPVAQRQSSPTDSKTRRTISYVELMHHWDTVFRARYQVSAENVVDDLEGNVRRIRTSALTFESAC